MKEESSDSYSHVLKYTGLFGGVQGLSILVGLVRNKCVALLLGPDGMGLASLLNSVQGFAAQTTNLGISSSAIPRLSELYERQDKAMLDRQISIVRQWSLLAAVLGFVFCVAISPLMNRFTFTWGDHTLHFALLAPAVAMLAITGGETAILKATRRLSSLAMIQVIGALASLVITIPLYYFLWQAGIVPVIVLTAFAVMVATVYYSYHCYPLRWRFSRQMLGEGVGIVRLGLSFVIAGAMGQGAEVLIRSVMNSGAELGIVGLYNAGYSMTVFYAAIVFSSIESDYYPRLSAVCHDTEQANLVINRQIEVLLLLISPMLVALMVFLPVLVPLLYSSEFVPVVSMAQVTVLAMYMKAISLPICYTPLARRDSKSFLLLELLYYTYFVLLVLYGFHRWGLLGTGIALTAAHVIEVVVAGGYAYFRYHYRVTSSVLCYAGVQIALGVAAYALTWAGGGMLYWVAGSLLLVASGAYSLYVLYQKTALWTALVNKVRSRFQRK